MENYTPLNANFSSAIPIVEESDLVNADNNNAAARQLIENDLALMDGKVDKVDGQGLVTDAEREVWNQTYQQSTGYTDQKIADLINGAPSTLDTLGEIASAMAENADVVEALEASIGSKATAAEMEILLGTKMDKTGDSKDATVTFTSNDTLTPSSFTDVSVLQSGETHKSILGKISAMFKNIRYIWKLLWALTASGAISEVKVVEQLPSDASAHTTTFYWVKE